MKISIIGYCGAGKSTLAAQLGQMLGTAVLHLDRVHWLAGWKERAREESAAIVETFLRENASGWVIDGNYTNLCYEQRMKESDLIIFLNFPRRICLPRVLRRKMQYNGRSRESMTEGCEEKIDLEFLLWVLIYGRDKKKRAQYANLKKQYSDRFVELCNPNEVARFQETLRVRIERGERT